MAASDSFIPTGFNTSPWQEAVARGDKWKARWIKSQEEIERLKAGGCARDQRTTQWCAEAVALRTERDEARAICKGWEHRYDALRAERDALRDLLHRVCNTEDIELWAAAVREARVALARGE